jgi:hypothetical protein
MRPTDLERRMIFGSKWDGPLAIKASPKNIGQYSVPLKPRRGAQFIVKLSTQQIFLAVGDRALSELN